MSLYSLHDVVYPPVGMAHLTQDLAHLVRHLMRGKQGIHVTTAAQPNSYPHLGTVMTLMTAFALGRHLADFFSVPVDFRFYELENSPGESITVDDITYEKSLQDTILDGQPVCQKYMESFIYILKELSGRSGIPYFVQTYQEFQSEPVFRRSLVQILKRSHEFTPIVSPSEGRLHVRFPCPECRYSDQSAATLQIHQTDNDSITLISRCFMHGDYSTIISDGNANYVDVNTPLRDILKGAIMIEDDKTNNVLNMTVAGNDWGGLWPLRIFCEGLALLGYRYEGIPVRFFTPIISDWSGAKFSKSLYVKTNTYNYLSEGFVNFSKFIEIYGMEGFDKLWREACECSREPRKFFRDYSVDYFRMILEQ